MVDDTKWQDVLAKLKRGITPRNVAVVGAARHNEFRWIQSHLPFHNNNGKVFHVNLNEKLLDCILFYMIMNQFVVFSK